MPIPVVVYILAALLVASLGKKSSLGFWGFFVISLILTPILGLIIILASDQADFPREKR